MRTVHVLMLKCDYPYIVYIKICQVGSLIVSPSEIFSVISMYINMYTYMYMYKYHVHVHVRTCMYVCIYMYMYSTTGHDFSLHTVHGV